MRLHLEGMGLNGALTALLLARYADVELTWSDTENETNAWEACTGIIYPADSTRFGPDRECYEQWAAWADGYFGNERWLQKGEYWFNHKQPPHEGRYRTIGPTSHGLTLASEPSFHVDAQRLVLATRSHLRHLRRDDGSEDVRIVTHGFSERLTHAYWGWTRLVRLEFEADYGNEHPPAFYFRKGRFVMCYAYPKPETGWHYAGSSLIKQAARKLKRLEIEPKYARWRRQFEELGGGAVRVAEEGEMREGWRPATTDTDWLVKDGTKLLFRPLWNSGLRHFPAQWNQLRIALGLSP